MHTKHTETVHKSSAIKPKEADRKQYVDANTIMTGENVSYWFEWDGERYVAHENGKSDE